MGAPPLALFAHAALIHPNDMWSKNKFITELRKKLLSSIREMENGQRYALFSQNQLFQATVTEHR